MATIGRRHARWRTSGAVIAAVVAFPLAAVPASAEQHRFLDPPHDIVRRTTSGEIRPAPRRSDIDLRRVVVRHGVDRISVRVHFRDLKVGRLLLDTDYITRFSRRVSAVAPYSDVRLSPAHPLKPDAFVGWDLDNCLHVQGGEKADGIRVDVSYLDDVLRLSFPRSCILGTGRNPRWVRAAVLTRTWGSRTSFDQASYPGADRYGNPYTPRLRTPRAR